MAKSVYGQLNQSNIGAGVDTLLREIFEGDKQKYAIESSAMDTLASTASDEASFQKLDKVLEDYWRRNNIHGPAFEAKEIKQRADYSRRKDEYRRFVEGHNETIDMVSPAYKISKTDKDGGIQNINTIDVASWNHEQLTKELGKVNRIRESFALGKNGYSYAPSEGNNTTSSLARDIDNYYESLTAALEIAVETNEIPRDDVLLRHIVSGRTDKVKEHSNEQRAIAAERYTKHDKDLDSLEDLHDKIISYENRDSAEWLKYMDGVFKGGEGEMAKTIFNAIQGQEGFNMDYNVYAENVGVAITDKIALRDQANKRHKQYTGKLYEEVDDSLRNKMNQFAKQGSSHETEEEKLKRLRDEQLKDLGTEDFIRDAVEKPREKVTPPESTSVKQPIIKDEKVEKPEEKLTWYQREQKRKVKRKKELEAQAAEFNRKSLARQMQNSGVTKAPFNEYLHSIVDSVSYEVTKFPENKKQAIEFEINKSIKISDPRLDTLFSQLNPSGLSRQDFGKAIIKAWKGIDHDVKFEYGSFSNFIEAILSDFSTVSEGRDLKITGVAK